MDILVNDETVLEISPDLIDSDIAGEIVLIGIETGIYASLDGIGSTIWQNLRAPISFGNLAAVLAEQFQGEPDVITRDTRRFVSELLRAGLVRLGHPHAER